jgi:hypothetical protein
MSCSSLSLPMLDCINVFDSLYSLLFPFIPLFHILAHHECHESVFLELSYLHRKKVSLVCELVVSLFELASQVYHGLSGALIVFSRWHTCSSSFRVVANSFSSHLALSRVASEIAIPTSRSSYVRAFSVFIKFSSVVMRMERSNAILLFFVVLWTMAFLFRS